MYTFAAEKPTKPYNVLEKSIDFKNENGRTVTVNGKDTEMLKKADLGVFAVSLKVVCQLAHIFVCLVGIEDIAIFV